MRGEGGIPTRYERCDTHSKTLVLVLDRKELSVRLPQFSASAGLYQLSMHSHAFTERRAGAPSRHEVEAAAIFQDSDGNLYSCEPKYQEGTITYLDCRRLGGDFAAPPREPPGYCWTETSCVLSTQWCQDRCIRGGRERVVRDWYYCGVCFGGDLPSATRTIAPPMARFSEYSL